MCQAVEKQRRDSMVTAHENLTPQTVVWRPAAAASLTSLLEIQNFSYRLRHTESEFAYRWSVCTWTYEKYSIRKVYVIVQFSGKRMNQ